MMTLASLESELRPFERQETEGYRPRYLFRGQTKHHGSITPLIARRPSPPAIAQLYTLFSDARLFATGIGGYRVSRRDGIGLFQHYGVPTPFIDFSGCLDVAIFFALLGAPVGAQAVIYVLDRSKLPDVAVSFELDFFCLPPRDGGLKHRHWRQDAFVVGPAQWQNPTCHVDINLASPPFEAALTTHYFTVSPADRAPIADIMSLTDDPLPNHLAALIDLWANERLSEPLHADIRECLREMLSYAGQSNDRKDRNA